MAPRSWLPRWFRGLSTPRTAHHTPRRPRALLACEPLEERTLLSASLPDWAEDNNSADEAFYLGRGGTLNWTDLNIHSASDVDWYTFRLVNPALSSSNVRILFSHADGDLDMTLYTADGTFIDSSAGVSDNEEISLADLPAGDYQLKVYGYSGATNTYDFQLNDTQSIGAGDFAEPNNQSGSAFKLPIVSGPGHLFGLNVQNSSDVDWFLLRLTATGTSANFARIDSFNNAVANLDIALYDADTGTLLTSTSGSGNVETLSLNGYGQGDYFLAAYGNTSSSATYRILLDLPLRASDDALEDNDTVATATNFGPLTAVVERNDLAIVSDDDDWFRFQINSAGTTAHSVRIDFSHVQGDLDLKLYNSAGTVELGSSTGIDDSEVIFLDGLAAGVYYVRVYGYSGADNPNYRLTITPPTGPAADADEENDSRLTAKDLGLLTTTHLRSDLSIETANDDDWYRFQIGSTGTTSNYVRLAFNHSEGDVDIELTDSTGAVLRSSVGVSNQEEISLNGLSAGVYFVRIFGYAGARNSDYTLTIEPPRSTASGDAFEPNETRATARNLGQIRSVAPTTFDNLSIHSTTDRDWFRFETVAAGASGHHARIDFTHSRGDLDVRLYASDGTPLDTSDGVGNSEIFSLAGLPAGTYYLEVYGYSSAVNPAYSLSILAPTGAGLSGDQYETNDSTTTATLVRSDSSNNLTGSIRLDNLSIHTSTDQDYFKFTTVATGTQAHQVRLQFLNANGNLDLQLLDAFGFPLGTSAGTGDSEALSLNGLPAGTYYARVFGASGAQNSYSLSLETPVSSNPGTNRDDWTILVYLTASDLDEFAFADINEMEAAAARLPGSVNLVVFWDQSANGRSDPYSTGNGTQAAWSTAGRAVIAADTNRSRVATTFEILAEQNTGNPNTLRDFIDWGTTAAPANRYALMLWDHGGGLNGFNFDDSDNAAFDFMTTNELVNALTGGPFMDIVAFDACQMAMTEVGYQLRSLCNVFAASQENEPGDGHDYTTLFRVLESNPTGVSAEALATGFVQSYGTQYGQTDASTYSAVRTSGYTDLATALNAFRQAAVGATANELTALRTARDNTPGYNDQIVDPTARDFRDLGRFMSLIAGNTSISTGIRNAATGVLNAISSMLISKTSDPRNSSGLSILLPEIGASVPSSYTSGYADFTSAANWHTFLNQLVNTSNRSVGMSPDFAEDNNRASQAYELNQLSGSGNQVSNLNLHSTTDEDWFRFSIGATATAQDRVRLTALDSARQVSVQLYNDSGTSLLSQANGSGAQLVSLAGRPAGTYLVRIAVNDGATGLAYGLTVDAPTVVGDLAGDNSTQDKAFDLGTVSGEREITGLQIVGGSTDWFTFTTPRQDVAVLSQLRVLFPTTAFLTAQVMDALGNVVASRDSGSGELLLEYQVSGGAEKYFVQLIGSGTTAYTLSFSGANEFDDDFERADTADLGANWTQQRGNDGITNSFWVGEVGSTNLTTLNGFASVDVSVQAQVFALRDETTGVLARVSATGDHYWACLQNVRNTLIVRLYRESNGFLTLLGSRSVTKNSGVLRLDAQGSILTVYFNGKRMLSAVDSAVSGSGVGVRGFGGILDNFRATPIELVSLPFLDSFARANRADPGANYTVRTGSFGVINQGLAVSSTGTALATLNTAATINASIRANVALPTVGPASAGLLARYNGPDDRNYYEAVWSVNNGKYKISLFLNKNGTRTLLSKVVVTSGTGELRFDLNGSLLEVYRDGVLVLGAINTKLSGPGQVGLRGSGAVRFDNFAV